MNMFMRQVYNVEQFRGYGNFFLAYSDGKFDIIYISFNDFSLKLYDYPSF